MGRYLKRGAIFAAAAVLVVVLVRYEMLPQRDQASSPRVFCYAIVPGDTTKEHAALLLSIQDAADCDDARLFSSTEYPHQPRMHKVYNQATWVDENWNNQFLQVSNAILKFYFSGRSPGFDWLVKIDADTWISPGFRQIFDGLDAAGSIVVSTGDGKLGSGTTTDGYFLSYSSGAVSSLRPLVQKGERCAAQQFSGQGLQEIDLTPCLDMRSRLQHVFPLDQQGYSMVLTYDPDPDDSDPALVAGFGRETLGYVTPIIKSGRGWCDPMQFDPKQAAKILGDPKAAELELEEYTAKGPEIVNAFLKKKAKEHGWEGLDKDKQQQLLKGVLTDQEFELCGKVFSLVVSKRGDRCFSNKLAVVHSRSLKGYEDMRTFDAGLLAVMKGA